MLWLIFFILLSCFIVGDLLSGEPLQINLLFIWSLNFNFLLYGLFNKANIFLSKRQSNNSPIDKLALLHYWISAVRLVAIAIYFMLGFVKSFTSYAAPELVFTILIAAVLLDTIVYLFRAIKKQLTA